MATSIIKGSDFKLNLNIDKIDGQGMKEYDFYVELYTSNPKPYVLKKEDLVKENLIDETGTNVILPIESSKLGTGKLSVRVVITLYDADFPDDERTEIVVINTGIEIKK